MLSMWRVWAFCQRMHRTSGGKRVGAPDSRVCANLCMDGLFACALIDSGASRSLIGYQFWLEICDKLHRPALTVRGERLKGLSGHIIDTFGVATIPLLGQQIRVHVAKSLQHDLLLGDDALRILPAIKNYEQGTVSLGGAVLPFRPGGQQDGELAGVTSEVEEWAKRWPPVFATDGVSNGCVSCVEMSIDTGCIDAMAIKQKPYCTPLTKRKVIEEDLDKMLTEGVIGHSSFSRASIVTLVPKRDGNKEGLLPPPSHTRHFFVLLLGPGYSVPSI